MISFTSSLTPVFLAYKRASAGAQMTVAEWNEGERIGPNGDLWITVYEHKTANKSPSKILPDKFGSHFDFYSNTIHPHLIPTPTPDNQQVFPAGLGYCSSIPTTRLIYTTE